MKKESLTKENFFNELNSEYPKGMKVFCDWIDKYKKENEWDSLFANYAPIPSDEEKMHMVKFHDIPYAMQLGIWIEFVCDRGGCSWEIEDVLLFDLREEITQYMNMLQAEIELMEQLDKA